MRRTDAGREQRLKAFAQRLNRLMLSKSWSGQELATRASTFVPESHLDRKTRKRFVLGRHLISAYCRAANEPTDANLGYIAKALGVRPEDLLPPVPGDERTNYASATSTLDGKTRLVLDTETDSDTAMKVLTLIRKAQEAAPKKRVAA